MRISDWSSDVCSSDLFLEIAAASNQSTLDIADRYTTLASLEWDVSDAATATARDMHALGLAPALVPQAQELLSFLLSARTNFPRSASHGFRRGDLWALGISGDHPVLLLRAGTA